MICPRCGESNATDAVQCDCGYDFPPELTPLPVIPVQEGPVDSAALRRQARRAAAEREMRQGALWCAVGLLITGLTYSAAAGGGVYIVAWGPVVFGAIRFFRGSARRH